MYQDRLDFIESINKFIHFSKVSVSNVLEQLNWSKETVLSSLHKSFQHGADNCSEVDPTDDSRTSDTRNNKSEDEGLSKVALSSEPLYSDLVASLSKAQSNLRLEENKSRAEALAEMLKMERDAKRRRINYKNRVHTKNKSHLEILREVLAEQMSTLPGFNAAETAVPLNECVLEKKQSELVEIQFPGGNPHSAWKTILDHISQEKKDRKISSKDYGHTASKERCSNSRRSNEIDQRREGHRLERSSKYSKDRSHYRSTHLDSDSDGNDKYNQRHSPKERNNHKYDVHSDDYKSHRSSERHMDKNNSFSRHDKLHKKDKTSEDSDYRKKNSKKSKKHKRNRSSSSSPSPLPDRHKSKKHKHKGH